MKEIKVKENYIYKGKIIKVKCDDAKLGEKAVKREVVEHGGGACVLCECEDGKIIFVRQYRYAVGEEVLEIPAGKLEEGEDPSAAAVRELKEETGYDALDLKHIATVYPSPGYTSEKIYIYFCKCGNRGNTDFDEDEDLQFQLMTAEEYLDYISGKIADSKTLIAVQRYILEKNKV